MNTIDKLKILSEDSQYDLSCACATGKNDRRRRGEDMRWLYPVSLPQGGSSLMLKTLLSNSCTNDCKYCPLRNETNIKRCTLQVEETAKIFMEYVKKKNIIGMFLSSGVINNPDYTMERINAVASILRRKYKYKGYLHLKIIPGASDAAIEETLSLSSAVSLNIETPGEKYFKDLSDSKNYINDIIRPMKLMSRLTATGERYSRVNLTTQFIVGASSEPDSDIVKYSFGLYKRLNFDRIYFSAYQAGLGNSNIPGEKRFHLRNEDLFTREHRLYQADFLIRKYGFKENEFYFEREGNFDLNRDPKQVWVDAHPEFFPIRINKADKNELLRVPGLGPSTAGKIIKNRKLHDIRNISDLKVKGKQKEKIIPYIIYE